MSESKPVVLRSTSNPTVRHLVRMRDNRARRKAGRVIVDGWRETGQAVAAKLKLIGMFVTQSQPELMQSSDPLIRKLATTAAADGHLQVVSEVVMEKIGYGQSSRGVVAEFEAPHRGLDQLELPPDPLVLVLDQIEKPGNIGAMFRCADAFGVDVILLCDSGDLWNPNAIRSSQGCVFHIRSAHGTEQELTQFLSDHAIRIVAARVESATELWKASLRGPLAILVGSEASGLGDRWTEVDGSPVEGVRIPMAGSIDSLNVSASAAVILYEAIRQRSQPSDRSE